HFATKLVLQFLLGRWAPAQSETYVRTYWHRVEVMQVTVARAAAAALGRYDLFDEEDLLERLSRFMRACGAADDVPERQVVKLRTMGTTPPPIGTALPSWWVGPETAGNWGEAPMLAGSPGELFAGSVWTIATDTDAPPEDLAQSVYRTPDGIAWTVDPITDRFDRVSSIAANQEQLVVVGFAGTDVRVATTQDGTTWSTSVAATLDAEDLSNETVPPGTIAIVNDDHVLVLVSSPNENGHAIGSVQARIQTALEERFPEATGPGGFTTDADGTIDGYAIDTGDGEAARGPLTDLLDDAEIDTLQNPSDIVTDQELLANDGDGPWTSTQLDPERTYMPARGLGFASGEPATGLVVVTMDGETWRPVALPGLGEIMATPVGVFAITDGSVYRAETINGPFVEADFGPDLSNDRGIRAIRIIGGDGTIVVTLDAAAADAERPIAVLVSDDGLDFRTVAVPPLADPAYWLTPLPGGQFLSQTTAIDSADGTLTIDVATIDPRGR
ncbi:MAG: hypothetical protein OSA99_09970, partial [Acidimicrobiales bacterium]|nr:hypothetical protein [Acidimicrobiales bacterium]